MSIADTFAKNPIAWILFALLIIAVHGNYQRGKELSRICELTGPHDVAVGNPKTPRQEIDNICVDRAYEGDPE